MRIDNEDLKKIYVDKLSKNLYKLRKTHRSLACGM